MPAILRGAREQSFDYPLSSRFDENDSVLLFDKALIPWEDVLVYRDLRRATGFYAESGFANLYNFQSGIRLGVKLELMIGLLSLGVRANGTQGFRGIQAALGELIALQHLLQALTTAMARDPERNAAGSAVPRLEYANALRIQVPQIWKRVRELLESALGGAPLVTVSGAADLRDGEARRLVDSYYRGAELEPEQRLKLFKLIWDATGSEFGARHAVYESHYSGNAEQIRLDSLAWASRRGHLAYCEAMVQRCMADYDIHGWLRGPGSMTERKRWLAGCLSALLSLPLAAAVPGGRARRPGARQGDGAEDVLALPRRRRQRRATTEPQLPEARRARPGIPVQADLRPQDPAPAQPGHQRSRRGAERGGRGQRLRLVRRPAHERRRADPGRPEATRTRPPALRGRPGAARRTPASPATAPPPRAWRR